MAKRKSFNQEFEIPREVWLHGELDSCLLRKSDQKMCCLGIYLRACGVAKRWLEGRRTPSVVERQRGLPERARWLLVQGVKMELTSGPATELMETNDMPGLSERGREKLIAAKFAEVGVKVRFTGRAK